MAKRELKLLTTFLRELACLPFVVLSCGLVLTGALGLYALFLLAGDKESANYVRKTLLWW